MRHEVGGAAGLLTLTAPLAPAARARGVRHAPGTACLVATRGLLLRGQASRTRAGASAIELAAIAAAAQQHLCAAARAHEQAGGMVDQLPGSSGTLPRTPPAAMRRRGALLAGNTTTLALHPAFGAVKGTACGAEAARPMAAAVPAYRSGTTPVLPHPQADPFSSHYAARAAVWKAALQGGLPDGLPSHENEQCTNAASPPVKKPSLAAVQRKQHLIAAARNAVSPPDKRAY